MNMNLRYFQFSLGCNREPPNRPRYKRRGSKFSHPRKIKNLWFDSETKLFKKRENDTITTKNIHIQFFKTFFLRNKKTVVHERKSENGNII